MGVTITLAKIADISTVTSLLNTVTLDLLEKGIRQWHYPWAQEGIKREVGLHNVYLVKRQGRVVGTFFIGALPKIDTLGIARKALYLSRIAVLPDYQGMDYGPLILQFCQDLGKEANLDIFLDCWSENDKLKQFYDNQNCEYLGDFAEENYYVSAFQLK